MTNNRHQGRRWPTIALALAASGMVLVGPVAGGAAVASSAAGQRTTQAEVSHAEQASQDAQFNEISRAAKAGARSPVTTVAGKAVALTVDDGPHPTYTPKFLQLFAKLRIKATFCLIGSNVKKYPKLVKQIAAGGHALCNHSMNHDMSLGKRSASAIHTDITATDSAIFRAGGVRPKFFRAPGGAWTSRLLTEVSRVKEIPLGWNVDPRDWARPGTSKIASVIANAKAGSIILCHDGGGDRSQTYAALQKALPQLKNRRLAFVIPR